ncbi:hypothetical protein FJT64_018819 [Amphibalanus amphitrite]|uniref:RNA-directed DNA polymerase n=1 Tax=Amphibalanus amphitrite TaxID=1232801 RepID=A0A6A4WXT8_AMPAM|nr:hypothetical protein FJT64_018819 [Amphibalanus amphitrite]
MQAQAELASIRQQPGEATRDFADRVRQAGREAYPGAAAGDPSVEATIVSRFVCGLRDEQLRMRVLTKDPASLMEAMDVAAKVQQQQDALRAMRPPNESEALAVRDRGAPGADRLDALERGIGELQRALQRLDTTERRDDYRTWGAGGNELQMLGVVHNLGLEIQQKTFVCPEVEIVGGLLYDIVLGRDFCCREKTVIDDGNGVIRLGSLTLPLPSHAEVRPQGPGRCERSGAANTGLARRCAQACKRAVALVMGTARAVFQSAGFNRQRHSPTQATPCGVPDEAQGSGTSRCGGGQPSSGYFEDAVTTNGPEMESVSRCEGGSPSSGNARQTDRETVLASSEVNLASEALLVADRHAQASSRPGVDGDAGDASPLEQRSAMQRGQEESSPLNYARRCISQQTPFDIPMLEKWGQVLGSGGHHVRMVDGLVGVDTTSGFRAAVPPSLRTHVMQLAHEPPTGGHLGHRRTTLRVKQNFVWPGMYKNIKEHCRTYVVPRGADKALPPAGGVEFSPLLTPAGRRA